MSLFAERFKQLRETTGKTQVVIANDLGVKPQTISYYANGREPSYDMLAKIAEYFNVTTDYLIGLTNSPARIPSAADDLGLSQEAIENLREMKKWDVIALDTVNHILLTFDGKPCTGLEDMVLSMDRHSVIGALTAYLTEVIRDSSIGVSLTKDGTLKLVDSEMNADLDNTQAVYPASEISRIMLEKNLLTALSELRNEILKYRKKFIATIEELEIETRAHTIKK